MSVYRISLRNNWISILQHFGTKVVFLKHVVFLEKEFLLREDNGSKVELGEIQDTLTDVSHLTEPKAVIHDDELIANSSKT